MHIYIGYITVGILLMRLCILILKFYINIWSCISYIITVVAETL